MYCKKNVNFLREKESKKCSVIQQKEEETMDRTMSTTMTTDANSTTTAPPAAANGNSNVSPSGVVLPDDVLEKVYQSYSLKQKRAGLKCFLLASLMFDIWAIFIPQGQSWEAIGKPNCKYVLWKRLQLVFFFVSLSLTPPPAAVLCCFLAANILLATFLRLCGTSKFHTIKVATWEIAPHAAWLIAIKQLALELIFRGTVTPR